jgi:hypothetical protein
MSKRRLHLVKLILAVQLCFKCEVNRDYTRVEVQARWVSSLLLSAIVAALIMGDIGLPHPCSPVALPHSHRSA